MALVRANQFFCAFFVTLNRQSPPATEERALRNAMLPNQLLRRHPQTHASLWMLLICSSEYRLPCISKPPSVNPNGKSLSCTGYLGGGEDQTASCDEIEALLPIPNDGEESTRIS